mgnify:CR=1 FL=1
MRTRIILASVGAAVVLFLLAGLTLVAAQTSMPNSPLYGIKLLREDLLERMAVDNADRLVQKFANIQTRFEEINLSLQATNTVPAKTTRRLQQQIDQYFQLAAQYDDTIQSAALMRLYEIILIQETYYGNQLSQVDPAIAADLENLFSMLRDRRFLIEFGLQNPAAFRSQILTGKWIANEINSPSVPESSNQMAEQNSPGPMISETPAPNTPTPASTPAAPNASPESTATQEQISSLNTETAEPIPDEDDLPPGFEDVVINPTPVEENPDDDEDNPPGIGDSPLYTATPGLDDEDDDEPPPGIDGPIYTATPSSGEDDEPPPGDSP